MQKELFDKGYRLRVMLVVWLTVFLGFVGYSLPYPIFGPMLMSADSGLAKGWSDDHRVVLFGLIMAAYPFAQFWGCPIIGRYTDMLGRKQMLVVTTAIAAIAHFLTGVGIVEHSLLLIVVSRMVGGFVEGNVAIAQSAASDISQGARKARNFAWINTAINAGWMVGPLMAGWLAGSHVQMFGYATPFYFAALFSILNTLVVIGLFIETNPQQGKRRADGRDSLKRFWYALFKSNLRYWYLMVLISDIGIIVFYSFFMIYMVKQFGFGPSTVAMYTVYVSIWLIVSNQLAAALMRRIDKLQIALYFHVVMAVGTVMLAYSTTKTALLISLAIAPLGVGICETVTSILISDLSDPKAQGEAMGICRSLFVLSEVIGAPLAGLMASYSLRSPSIICVITALIVCNLLMARGKTITGYANG